MEEILHQLIGSYPIIYKVFYIPGGAGFLPSTVLLYRRFYATNPIMLPKPFESPKKKKKKRSNHRIHVASKKEGLSSTLAHIIWPVRQKWEIWPKKIKMKAETNKK